MFKGCCMTFLIGSFGRVVLKKTRISNFTEFQRRLQPLWIFEISKNFEERAGYLISHKRRRQVTVGRLLNALPHYSKLQNFIAAVIFVGFQWNLRFEGSFRWANKNFKKPPVMRNGSKNAAPLHLPIVTAPLSSSPKFFTLHHKIFQLRHAPAKKGYFHGI